MHMKLTVQVDLKDFIKKETHNQLKVTIVF